MALTLSIFNNYLHKQTQIRLLQRQEAAKILQVITYSQLTYAINNNTLPHIYWKGKIYIPEKVVNELAIIRDNVAILFQDILASYEDISLCNYFTILREDTQGQYEIHDVHDVLFHISPRGRTPRLPLREEEKAVA